MKLAAVLFDSGRGSWRRAELAVEDLERALRTSRLPAAYVVKSSDLPCLREGTDAVWDAGQKDPRTGLADHLLGRKREGIPLIEAGYSSAGRLKQGVETLLENARKGDEKKLFVIGGPGEVFAKLWRSAEGRGRGGEDLSWWSPGTAPDGTEREDWRRRLRDLLPHDRSEEDLRGELVGASDDIELLRLLAARAARANVPVLIIGDTGTGKEVVARMIHDLSDRRADHFVAVNCGAIPRELLESELFGHIKGIFTGATSNKEGLWERADGGTLFLDEVGDLSLDHQTRILRALQEKKIRRVGGLKDIKVDARIVAATNQPLGRMIERGQFRKDLYYRLRALLIRTTPLRDHPEDIPILAQQVWEDMEETATSLSEEVLDALQSHSWPGNVRELKIVLRTMNALFAPDEILPEHVKVVLEMQGSICVPGAQRGSEAEFELHRAQSLQHLIRTGDALRACELLTRPLTERGKTDEDTIERTVIDVGEQLHHLSRLCRHPILYGDDETFRAVDHFGQDLLFFREKLEDDVEEAVRFWENDAGRSLKAAIESVFEEVGSMTRPDKMSS